MRQLDNIGNKLCEYQADLFEHSAKYTDCSSLVFVRQFMISDIACRMDKGAFVFESLDLPACLDELSKEKKLTQGKEKYPGYILRWIGYMYRYIAYTRNLPSRYLFLKVKTKKMYSLYEAYHSLDPEAAAIRILEICGIADNDTSLRALAEKLLL